MKEKTKKKLKYFLIWIILSIIPLRIYGISDYLFETMGSIFSIGLGVFVAYFTKWKK